jgi:ketosteroid isomerase-like protein
VPGLAQEPARALVESWLAAQNNGDFAAYEGLYAARFTGIKRAGDRTRRLDRKKWLADRQRMFTRAMKVEAADLSIEPTRGGAIVSFTQTWESGTFKDVGPKQLVLVNEGTALHIAREEMLASTIAGVSADAPALTANQFLAVVSSEGFVGVVLQPSVDPAKVAHEAPVSLERGQAAWARVGGGEGTYELFGAAGKVCEVSGLERGLFANATFHFGQVQTWDGTFDGLDPSKDKVDDATVAREVLDLAGDGVHEVVKVDAAACNGALWARLKVDGPAVVFASVDAAPFAARLRTELRKTGNWKRLQAEFEADETVETTDGTKGRWDEWESSLSASAFAGPDGTTWVSLSVSAGTGCGTFGGETWGLWRVTQAGEWTLLSDGDNPGEPIAPMAAFDADGDGKPELTDGQTLVQPVGASWRATKKVASPDFDCPC